MKRYTKREVSRLLGEVRHDHAEFRKAERGDGDAFSFTCWCRKCDELSRVVRQMRRDLAGRTWRPIATAPKDGSEILCLCSDIGPRVLEWRHGKWNLAGVVGADDYEPTHWMPLPDGPGEG